MFSFFRSTRQKWIPVQYMLVDFWSAERVASLPTPVQGGALAPHPLMSIQKQSCPQVFLCHGWGAWCLPWLVLPLVLLGGHWLQWSVTLGGPHDLGHHQGVRLIFQSCYGVGVTFRVAPMWVKCMFCPSLTRNTHSKLQEKEKKKNHIRRRLKSFYMLDLKRLYALEILAVSLMKVAIMDCDAL